MLIRRVAVVLPLAVLSLLAVPAEALASSAPQGATRQGAAGPRDRGPGDCPQERTYEDHDRCGRGGRGGYQPGYDRYPCQRYRYGDPYARDPYYCDPYYRDPYSRDPYYCDRYRDGYSRDPYCDPHRRYRDPYGCDPNSRYRDPYSCDRYGCDPYSRDYRYCGQHGPPPRYGPGPIVVVP